MNKDDAEEYTQSLGQIVGGSFRQIMLAEKLGVPKALGLTTKEWVQNRLGNYPHYSISERQKIVKELAAEGVPQRKIADVLGVSKSAVNRDSVPNGTPASSNPAKTNGSQTASVPNGTPAAPWSAPASNSPAPNKSPWPATSQPEPKANVEIHNMYASIQSDIGYAQVYLDKSIARMKKWNEPLPQTHTDVLSRMILETSNRLNELRNLIIKDKERVNTGIMRIK